MDIFQPQGVTDLYCVTENLSAHCYVHALEKWFLPLACTEHGTDENLFGFTQDSVSLHSTSVIRNILNNTGIKYVDWPAALLDLK